MIIDHKHIGFSLEFSDSQESEYIMILLFVPLFVLILLQLFIFSIPVFNESQGIQSSLIYRFTQGTRSSYSHFPGSLPNLQCPVHSVNKTESLKSRTNVKPRIKEFYGSSQTVQEENHVSSNVTLVYSTK